MGGVGGGRGWGGGWKEVGGRGKKEYQCGLMQENDLLFVLNVHYTSHHTTHTHTYTHTHAHRAYIIPTHMGHDIY